MDTRGYLTELLSNKMFNQEQIAEIMGVDQSMISKWKNGEREITTEQFEKLCGIFGYSLADYSLGISFRPIKVAFSAKMLEKDDIIALGKINKILANLNYMELLINNETGR